MISHAALLARIVCSGVAMMVLVAAAPGEICETAETCGMSLLEDEAALGFLPDPHKYEHELKQAEKLDEKDESTADKPSSTIDGPLLFSFMVLRALAAGQSVNPESNRLMWVGVAVAAVSRMFYEGRDPLTNPSVLLVSSFKELSHVSGLAFVLQSFNTNSTDEASETTQ